MYYEYDILILCAWNFLIEIMHKVAFVCFRLQNIYVYKTWYYRLQPSQRFTLLNVWKQWVILYRKLWTRLKILFKFPMHFCSFRIHVYSGVLESVYSRCTTHLYYPDYYYLASWLLKCCTNISISQLQATTERVRAALAIDSWVN